MKLGSLFDGAGGFPFAAQICGIDPVWASEIEPFPVAVTSKRFPNMKHLGDVTKINGAEIEPVDIITFGSPCQDLSVAGKRAGLEGERSGLFMEAIRIIKEMRDATANEFPRFGVWENVPGAFSSAKGEDFRAVLAAFCQVKDSNAVIPRPPKGKWADAGEIVGDGYSVAWRVLDAQFWGVPQRRRRIFFVADFRGERAGEILFEREGLRRNFAESRASWKGIAKSLAFCADAEERTVGAFMGGQGSKAGGIAYSEDLAPTLKSALSGSNTVPDKDNFQAVLCVRERCGCEIIALDRAAYNQGVNAQYDPGIDDTGKAFTVIARGPGAVCYALSAKQQSLATEEDIACTLGANVVLIPAEIILRRLTPTECARLQGMPDWWCDDVPHSDSAEYKMWGNGMALPCVLYVMEGIKEALEKDE